MDHRKSSYGDFIIAGFVYTTLNGTKISPVFSPLSNQWYIGSRAITLTELGELCKISEQDLLALKLTYGG
jgi:hypothetical protein